MQQKASFSCPKCGHPECEAGEVRMSGGLLSSFFDMQNKRFTTVSCVNCGYTEMYKGNVSALAKIFDFLGS